MPRQQERQGGSEKTLSLSLGNPTLRKNSTARRIRKKASGHPETSNKTHMQRMQHPFGKYNKQWLVLAIAARSWTSRQQQQQTRRAPNPNAPSPSSLLHLGSRASSQSTGLFRGESFSPPARNLGLCISFHKGNSSSTLV